MALTAVLIANRGEIAIRIARAVRELGLKAVTVHSLDDADSLHARAGTDARALPGRGAAAYLDAAALTSAAISSGCDAIHPGYGFLSEQGDFARACADAGLTFIGPSPDHLDLFGDKARARAAAMAAGVPVTRGIDRPVTAAEAAEFQASLGDGVTVMLKAVAGGGGRGARVVRPGDDMAALHERASSEARAAFGSGDLYVEAFLERARHIEVQILGDDAGNILHLGERECSLQRRFQKVVELAPAPSLDPALRDAICEAAMRLAGSVGYRGLGTFEFLLDATGTAPDPFVFIEANARLQVEHTVTEEVTGVDLVATQIRLAAGDMLDQIGLDESLARPRGAAVQARVNMERIGTDGSVRPGGGTLSVYEPPGGPGVRVDGFGYAGYTTSPAYDSLLAKVICHGPSHEVAMVRCARALDEFRMEGVATNLGFLKNIVTAPEALDGTAHTRWVEDQIARLASVPETAPKRSRDGHAGAAVDTKDPLAVFAHGAQARTMAKAAAPVDAARVDDGRIGVTAPIQGTIVSIDVALGDAVAAGRPVAVVEAMKMEHILTADRPGIVAEITMEPGDVVREGWAIVRLDPAEVDGGTAVEETGIDPDHIRPDLQEVIDRHAYTLDENRPAAVDKRHKRGFKMIREVLDQMLDPGSFNEYEPLVVASRHKRADIETLRRTTPADGVIVGTATVNADTFGDPASRVAVVAYDYTVLAGTQGRRNHQKQDRIFELAVRFKLPLILFSEGGGGRPGDDVHGPSESFNVPTFTMAPKLSGLVPMVGINNGYCFAGNSALLAACDVIIATEASTIAMGGPAMIEGGGLGVYTPDEVGPMSMQVSNGVVDILVRDEDEAVAVAKKYLSYFQGPVAEWEAPDQRPLRHIVPEKRTRLYDMRQVIQTLADTGSVLEIRKDFGIGVITAFARIEGRPVGIIANNPHHLAGALDSDGSDKGARFLQLCDAFDIPVVSLMDCPGIMVGPDHEQTALVRHAARMFQTGANIDVPLFSVVVRKGYGLGVLAMCGGSGGVGLINVAWPTAEFAGMNIEGAVKLGYRDVLMAIEDPEERRIEFETRVADSYEKARAVNSAAGGGLDDVIDPADTRRWIANGLRGLPPPPKREGKKYRFIDTW
ncbi:acetyl-CoA carboxylase family protein [Chachezhania sediminis]|uniref:acetyl-CoA carboxylase family protein n=1 Tax=Chachezhania sediminis TaxID=2599291 RepID=UPI00131C7200|nr:carboxyl transferase domain-containing protein [Chachezhania sediminis]